MRRVGRRSAEEEVDGVACAECVFLRLDVCDVLLWVASRAIVRISLAFVLRGSAGGRASIKRIDGLDDVVDIAAHELWVCVRENRMVADGI